MDETTAYEDQCQRGEKVCYKNLAVDVSEAYSAINTPVMDGNSVMEYITQSEIKEVEHHNAKDMDIEKAENASEILKEKNSTEAEAERVGHEACSQLIQSSKGRYPKDSFLHKVSNVKDQAKNACRLEKTARADVEMVKRSNQGLKAYLSPSFPNPSRAHTKGDSDNTLKSKQEAPYNQSLEGSGLPPSKALHQSNSNLSRSNFTVPQPFALATDKRASISSGQLAVNDCITSKRAHRHSVIGLNTFSKDAQVFKGTDMGAKHMVSRSLHAESAKVMEDHTVKVNGMAELKAGDDDVHSVSSVYPFLLVLELSLFQLVQCTLLCDHERNYRGSKSFKAKAVAAAMAGNTKFSFKCDERAEKRRQFYTKLEEMHIAKEEEKSQRQAKTKEEGEAELKQLRKSLTFKATPMPMFYREAPPKIELKKIPTTRPKSPKLGRKASSTSSGTDTVMNVVDVPKSSEQRVEKNAIQNHDAPQKPARRSLSRAISEKYIKIQAPEGTEGANEGAATSNADSFRGGFKVSEQTPVDSGAGLTQEGGSPVGDGLQRETHESTVEVAKSVNEGQAKLSSSNAASDKGKADSEDAPNSYEQVSKADNDHDKKASKAPKKEHIKGSTPSFHLRKGDVRSQSLKRSMKSEQEMPSVVANVAVQS